MNTPFQLAPDAQTRDIECGQFSRTAEGAPFCACLKHPYCCGVGESPETCSFRIPKGQKPHTQPKQPKGQGPGHIPARIPGYYTVRQAAQATGISKSTVSYRLNAMLPALAAHTIKRNGTLYFDDFMLRHIVQRKTKRGEKNE